MDEKTKKNHAVFIYFSGAAKENQLFSLAGKGIRLYITQAY